MYGKLKLLKADNSCGSPKKIKSNDSEATYPANFYFGK
jgi:hypothetical protein